MLRFLGQGARLCDGRTRREILRVGGLGLLGAGLNLPELARGAERPAERPLRRLVRPAKSCIVLFLMGGPPQHSTWDPKPDAPAEVRGEFGSIATNVPGLSLSGLLPMTAQQADKICTTPGCLDRRQRPLVERLLHADGPAALAPERRERQPGRAQRLAEPRPTAGQAPGRPRGGLPASVTLPHRIFNTDGSVWPGQDAGFLGRASDPWLLNAQGTPGGYRVREIDLPADLDAARVGRRMDLIDGFRKRIDDLDRDPAAKLLDEQTRRAFDLLRSSEARRAFKIEDELSSRPASSYGATPFGQGGGVARLEAVGGGRSPAGAGQLVPRRRRAAR